MSPGYRCVRDWRHQVVECSSEVSYSPFSFLARIRARVVLSDCVRGGGTVNEKTCRTNTTYKPSLITVLTQSICNIRNTRLTKVTSGYRLCYCLPIISYCARIPYFMW